jgi:hypothetical protein
VQLPPKYATQDHEVVSSQPCGTARSGSTPQRIQQRERKKSSDLGLGVGRRGDLEAHLVVGLRGVRYGEKSGHKEEQVQGAAAEHVGVGEI